MAIRQFYSKTQKFQENLNYKKLMHLTRFASYLTDFDLSDLPAANNTFVQANKILQCEPQLMEYEVKNSHVNNYLSTLLKNKGFRIFYLSFNNLIIKIRIIIQTESAWPCHYRNGTKQRILDILNMNRLPQQCYVIFQFGIIQFL